MRWMPPTPRLRLGGLAAFALLLISCGPGETAKPPGPALAGAAKTISIDLDRQLLMAWEGQDLAHRFHVVTGTCAKWTLSGTYHVFNKIQDYTSKTYGVAMPYTMFFTEDGKAIHGTKLATIRSFLHKYVSNTVGSKGCVGLSNSNAKRMFEWAPMGTPVVILQSERNVENREYPEE
jgi:hypothetical protein